MVLTCAIRTITHTIGSMAISRLIPMERNGENKPEQAQQTNRDELLVN